MQIQQQVLRTVQQTGQADQLRDGEVYRATMNEKIGDREANVTIRGREIKVAFEGERPDGERVTLQVMGREGDITRVRAIAEEGQKQNTSHNEQNKSVSQTLRQLGATQPSPELRQAAQMVMEKGVPLTKESVQELQRFLAEGNKQERLQTVQAAANKRLEMTANHLKSVHEAIHGRPLNQVLNELAQEIDKDFKVEARASEKQPVRTATTNEANARQSESEVRVRLNEQLQQLERSPKAADRELARAVREVIQGESSFSRGVEQARALVEQSTSRPPGQQPSAEAVQRMNDALSQAEREQVRPAQTQTLSERVASEPNRSNVQSETNARDSSVRTRLADQLHQLERSPKAADRELARAVREVIQRESSLSRGVEQARAFVEQSTSRPLGQQPSAEAVQRIHDALTQAEREQPRTTQNRVPSEQRPVTNESPRAVQAQKEPTVQRATELVRQQLANQPQLSRDAVQLIERALAEADHLDKVGRERIEQVVRQIEKAATTDQDRELAQQLRATLKGDASISKIAEQSRAVTEQTTNSTIKQQVEKVLSQAQQLEQVGKEKMLQALAKLEQLAGASEGIETTEATEKTAEKSLADTLKQAQTAMQKEANFIKAIEHLQAVLNHPAMSEESKSALNEAKNEALQRMDQGRELAARQLVAETMQQLEQTARAQEVYTENEQYQTSIDMASKTIAVTTITEKLAQMTAEFKSMQRDMTRTLDVVTRQLDQFRNQAQAQVKPLLETTIKKLDNAILRSEMMLLTDMKTEKRLMQASGQLAEAKKLLAKGDHRGANQIVKDVKQLIERLNFQPSDTKVKHYVAMNEKAQPQNHKPSEQFTQQFNETVSRTPQEGSARAMFEMVRSVGLNRDNEMANLLASNRHADGGQEETEQNIKSALMKLMKTEEEGSRTSQLASQALTNVTGQQLLSRSDQQGNMQNMFFNLPFLLQEKVQNLQVFVNSRNEGDKVDWENCQLYFLMETPRMGEVGIMVQASDRQLSVTLKNNDKNFQLKMKPLIDATIERLSEIGYVIKDIKFSLLTSETEKETERGERASSQRPIFTKEGFDFKI